MLIRVLPVVLILALYVYTFIDLATARSADVRLLPRLVWLLVIVVIPVVGPILWLTLGRPVSARGGGGGGLGAKLGKPPGGPRPPRPPRPIAPDDDPDFLRGLGRPGPEDPPKPT